MLNPSIRVLRGYLAADDTLRVKYEEKEHSLEDGELSHLDLLQILYVDLVKQPGEFIFVFKELTEHDSNWTGLKLLRH